MSPAGRLAFLAAAIAAAGVLRASVVTDPAYAAVTADALPGESIYHLDVPLTTADKEERRLADLRGRPALITMFYASCQGTCPLIAFAMNRMTAVLSAAERRRLQVVMVSFDPARDTPAVLADFAALHRLDSSRWWLARTHESAVRDLAALLGIRYRETSTGVFSHSAVIALIDVEGRIVQRTSTLDALDASFVAALRSVAGAP